LNDVLDHPEEVQN